MEPETQDFKLEEQEDTDSILGAGIQQKFGAMMMAFAIIFMFVALIPHKDSDGKGQRAGTMCFELYWSDAINEDIDMWVKGPDGIPIGYNNKNGVQFDLLRDDLGFQLDLSGKNAEITCARQVVPGSYTMNAYWFADHNTPPMTGGVDVEGYLSIELDNSEKNTKRQEIKMHAHIDFATHEVTTMQFIIGDDLGIVASSVNQALDKIYASAPASGSPNP